MNPHKKTTIIKPGLYIPSDSGSPATSKEPTTLVEAFPIPSQSTLNIDSNNNGSNIELQASDVLSDQTQQPWVSYSSELRMVGCFALMVMMVSLDALILIPVLPVSLFLHISHFDLDRCDY
jgi:hypothetical protein